MNKNTLIILPTNFEPVNHVIFFNSGKAGLNIGYKAYTTPAAATTTKIQPNTIGIPPITGKSDLTTNVPTKINTPKINVTTDIPKNT